VGTSGPAGIRVLIVEDDVRTRDGLRLLIDESPGYSVSGVYGSVEEGLSHAGAAPDVMLLDIHLPGRLGSEAVPDFRDKFPRTAILMFTVYQEESKVFESICNGADGYLLKKTTPDRLLQAISEAHGDGAPMSPEVARKVIRLFRRTNSPTGGGFDLTPHEVRILKMLSRGYSYQAVGDELSVSINTVRSHIRSIYDKLHVHSKSEAVGKALRSGLI
jgi:DNA-binding NarL/FixJ family response regulator